MVFEIAMTNIGMVIGSGRRAIFGDVCNERVFAWELSLMLPRNRCEHRGVQWA